MYLGRRISRAKWAITIDSIPNDIPADAISDIRTQSNTLSFWKCGEASETDLDEIALALALANRDRVDKLEIIWIDQEKIRENGIHIALNSGDTLVVDLKDLHRDLESLTYGKLGSIASQISTALNKGQFKIFTRGQVTKLIEEAVKLGRVDKDSLPVKISRLLN